MVYKVIMTESAQADLDSFIRYLLLKKKSIQAASNLIDDFEATRNNLSLVAGSIKFCDNPRLKKLGYKRLNFLSHRYFLLYRVDGENAIIDNIFHELQDYESRIQ